LNSEADSVLIAAVVVIPARYASSRFPGKILARQTGKYLIQHVYEQASKAKCAGRVIIAADDPRTVEAARSFGADVVMTDPALPSGTDRVAAAVADLADAELVINVQGDEPQIHPECIDQLAGLLSSSDAPMATLATPFGRDDDLDDPNLVKVVCDRYGRALYFSRSLIPFPRDGREKLPKGFRESFLLHLGIYGYRREFLLELTQFEPAPLEEIERLEQLRVLWRGYTIQVGITPYRSRGIDTPEQYKRFVESQMKGQGRTTDD
jgi:3-deoxy-manno-octulosonate cytidylyltransferase (CMP-KDO synthetase)